MTSLEEGNEKIYFLSINNQARNSCFCKSTLVRWTNMANRTPDYTKALKFQTF